MKSLNNSFKFFGILLLTFSGFSTFAGDINWSGKYQVESQLIKNPNLGSSKKESSFLTHHLVLNPHVVAADGITINSRFDIFNNADYPNSQFGEFFGGTESTGTDNKAASGELASETLAVTELYMSWVQQFGSFLVGRAPVQFGLGLTHNAGNEEFDHWFNRKDLAGYKFVMGNIFIMPMYGKVNEGDPQSDDDIRDYMIHVGYENLDTDLQIGFFYQKRKASPSGNDLTTTTDIYNVTATKDGTSAFDVQTYNLFVKKKSGAFTVGLEASMQDGSTGLIAGGEKVEIDSYALAAQIDYTRENSKWAYDLKMGMISGDDTNTTNRYEGYLVDRNYDVALLMFNYMLGNGSSIIGNENYIKAVTDHGSGSKTTADVGQISNTLYFAPGAHWKWNDKWGMKGRLTYAQLSQVQQTDQAKDLGYELDLSVYYRPFERFVVQLDTGYLMTGDAFKGGTLNLDNKDAYGILTKAAISF